VSRRSARGSAASPPDSPVSEVGQSPAPFQRDAWSRSGASPPIRLSLDVSAVPERPAGSGRYVLDLAAHLAARSEVELYLVTRAGDTTRWQRLAPGAELVGSAPAARPVRLLWEQASLPRLLAGARPDLHHSPHFTMPEAASVPRVVTIHDLSIFDHPEWHPRVKVGVFRRAVAVAAERADGLLCVTRATADRLQERFSPRGVVAVVEPGVDLSRFSPAEPEAGSDHAVLASLGVRRPYVVFVGTADPRKDAPTLVRAFDRMCPAHPGLSLVIAGGTSWDDEPLRQALAEARARQRIRHLGYLPDAAVAPLLRNAAAAAYPLLRDGFGLPVLEAMACGSPLVTTDRSAMRHLTAESALLVPPGDAGALAGALDMLVTGDADLAARRRRGLEIAAAHSWEASASTHILAYRKVLAARG
jgi:glycosyltransferase involved in cell wall biosynthesis